MLIYWIWFAELNKISCSHKDLLLRHFRDPEELYHTDAAKLSEIDGITDSVIAALEDKSLENAQRILRECHTKGIRLLTQADKAYPDKLRNTYDPPILLYYRGRLPDWNRQPLIGIVGTRKATSYGMRAARRYGGQIAACGGMVVSGGAAGVDTMALEGAMGAGGSVMCIMGCGVDVAYPAKNRGLFEEIAQRGCLISEYPPKAEAAGWHFPQRNRIISGMSNGVLVVEAPTKSGALITARLAMEQGRDVFVVPGNVDEENCIGSNELLQESGIAALSGWDVIKEYQSAYPGIVAKRELPEAFEKPALRVAQEISVPQPVKVPDKKSIDKDTKSSYSVVDHSAPALNAQEQAVYQHITREPVAMDTVIAAAGLPAGTVKSILTRLTIKGCVQNLPGGRIARKS